MAKHHRDVHERLADIASGIQYSRAMDEVAAVEKLERLFERVQLCYRITGRHSDADKVITPQTIARMQRRTDKMARQYAAIYSQSR